MALGPVLMDEADDEDDVDDTAADGGKEDRGADTTASAEAVSVRRDDARGTNVCSIGTAATAGFFLEAAVAAADRSVLAISSSSSNA